MSKSGTDWLERRITEVTSFVPSEVSIRERRTFDADTMTHVVVALKLRTTVDGWAWLKQEFRKWEQHKVDGKFDAKDEREFPTWFNGAYPRIEQWGGVSDRSMYNPW